MKTSRSTIKKAVCSMFGHRYVVSKKITPHITEYQCKTCKCEITTTETGHLDVLTPELKEINETLAKFYRKRHALQSVA
ncbi:hypothetical protein OSR52_12920 [Galbibacter sp. CMA-7]|uniref:Prophage protein DUF1660 n=1 Tax=Galbibacter pacificus TaxID=2996052 RepID=A0ABT6FU22_9FLAO|nr:hypothetical protein [Galbibacter pacificus]MDG3583290.1 hypothetical protein [Galbibacter pacificus]MDG3586771.1 hypothetical protein [Galbibacter pacificus]